MGATYPFDSPSFCFVWSCLLWPSSMSSCIHCRVHYPPASMGIDIIPSTLCTCSLWGLWPHHITWGIHPSSVDAPVNIQGRSCNFPFFHPREALLIGHWVTALPLFSCGILFLSPWEVVLHGVRLVHLSHVWQLPRHNGMPTSDATRRSQFHWGLVTFYVGSSLHKRGCLLWSDAPPPRSPLPTYPWSSSSP